MGIYVLKDAKLWAGKYNLSGDSNQIGLTYEGEEVESTCMNEDGAKAFMSGLTVSRINANGFLDYAEGGSDIALFSKIGLDRQPLSISPETGGDGEIAYFTESNHTSYEPGATVGEMMAFSANAVGTNKLVRGKVMLTGTVTISASGAIRQLGAASAAQSVYAAMHVFSAAGTNPTMDMVVESDDAETFLAPTTRLTFAQVTTVATSEFKSAVGPMDGDTWWRVNYTLGGTNASYVVAVVIGIA